MNLRSLLAPERVRCQAAARSRKHTLDLIADLLARASGGRVSATQAFDAMVSRERLGCTALGDGVAMPHGRVAGIDAPIGAFMRLATPVDFDTPDDAPVDLVFALLVPESCEACQSAELAALAKLFSDPEFRQRLRGAGSARELYEQFPAPAPERQASVTG
jgi:nitrogen PTS system EIIA component